MMKKDEGRHSKVEPAAGGVAVEARFELRHLRYFRAVAEELSFTRAAERLHIAQPPLSQQIKQLEDDLGVLLLDRAERPLRLTEAGRHLHEKAIDLLSALQTTIDEVKRIGRGMSGRLAIGFAGSAMYSLLPRVLNVYRSRYPGVELVFTELLAAEIGAAIETRRIDVGISRPGIDPSDAIEQKLLVNEPLIIAAPERHPFSKEVELSIEQLHEQDVILYPRYPRPSLTDLVLRTLERDAVCVRIVQEVSNLQTALGLVAAGVGVTFVPVSVGLQRRSGIHFLPLDPQVLFSPMTVVWLRGASSVTLQNFLDIVDQHRLLLGEDTDELLRHTLSSD